MAFKEDPVVSILVPSYNHARFLRECVNSVQAQTLTDWELIVVDDRSSDESVDLANELAEHDSRIRIFVNERNLGTYGTEQRALGFASGSYIAVMNSDDRWAPGKLSCQVEQLGADMSAAYSYVAGALIDDNGELIHEDVHRDWPTSNPQEPLPYLLYENRILASGVLFRRNCLSFETSCRYSGDWVALLKQSLLGRTCFIGEPMTFWRQHVQNTYRRSIRQMLEEIRVRKAIHDAWESWFVRSIPPTAIQLGLAKNAWNLFVLLTYFRDVSSSRRFAWVSLRNHIDKNSLKGALSGYLNQEFVRNRLWTLEDRELAAGMDDQLLQMVRESPPLTLA